MRVPTVLPRILPFLPRPLSARADDVAPWQIPQLKGWSSDAPYNHISFIVTDPNTITLPASPKAPPPRARAVITDVVFPPSTGNCTITWLQNTTAPVETWTNCSLISPPASGSNATIVSQKWSFALLSGTHAFYDQQTSIADFGLRIRLAEMAGTVGKTFVAEGHFSQYNDLYQVNDGMGGASFLLQEGDVPMLGQSEVAD
jgi:hypothetical protein